jgi:hypothetical protein
MALYDWLNAWLLAPIHVIIIIVEFGCFSLLNIMA